MAVMSVPLGDGGAAGKPKETRYAVARPAEAERHARMRSGDQIFVAVPDCKDEVTALRYKAVRVERIKEVPKIGTSWAQ